MFGGRFPPLFRVSITAPDRYFSLPPGSVRHSEPRSKGVHEARADRFDVRAPRTKKDDRWAEMRTRDPVSRTPGILPTSGGGHPPSPHLPPARDFGVPGSARPLPVFPKAKASEASYRQSSLAHLPSTTGFGRRGGYNFRIIGPRARRTFTLSGRPPELFSPRSSS